MKTFSLIQINQNETVENETKQQNENLEQPPPQPDVEGPQNVSESSNEEKSRGHILMRMQSLVEETK